MIEYALEESRRLKHNYVGTEHVLLGLIREHEGVAAQVLMNLGLKLDEVREEVLNLLGAGVSPSRSESTLVRDGPSTGRILLVAAEEAGSMSSQTVDPEHLLLALLRDTEHRAGRILKDAGLTLEDVRRRLRDE